MWHGLFYFELLASLDQITQLSRSSKYFTILNKMNNTSTNTYLPSLTKRYVIINKYSEKKLL